jgi:hypothetical protein
VGARTRRGWRAWAIAAAGKATVEVISGSRALGGCVTLLTMAPQSKRWERIELLLDQVLNQRQAKERERCKNCSSGRAALQGAPA